MLSPYLVAKLNSLNIKDTKREEWNKLAICLDIWIRCVFVFRMRDREREIIDILF